MSGRLTADEAAFLNESGALGKAAKPVSKNDGRRSGRRPRLPIKTMIAVAFVALALCLTAQGAFSAAKPYVELAGSSEWAALGGAANDLSDTDQAYVNSVNEVSQIWQYRSAVYVTVVVLAIVVELALYLQWSMRLSSWENRHEVRREEDKGLAHRGSRSGGSGSSRSGYRAHTEGYGQRTGRRQPEVHAGKHYVNIRPDDAL